MAVVPDATDHGYWVVTSTGAVYAFGDAVNHGAPGPQSTPITSAVATANRQCYWIRTPPGRCSPTATPPPWGTAARVHRRPGSGGHHLRHLRRGRYWISTALGKVTPFGDAPDDGDVSAPPPQRGHHRRLGLASGNMALAHG